MLNLFTRVKDKIVKLRQLNALRDVYQCEIIVYQHSTSHTTITRQFDVPKGLYPKRRCITKAFASIIERTIKENRPTFNNATVFVTIVCKVGTFKYKDITYKKLSVEV